MIKISNLDPSAIRIGSGSSNGPVSKIMVGTGSESVQIWPIVPAALYMAMDKVGTQDTSSNSVIWTFVTGWAAKSGYPQTQIVSDLLNVPAGEYFAAAKSWFSEWNSATTPNGAIVDSGINVLAEWAMNRTASVPSLTQPHGFAGNLVIPQGGAGYAVRVSSSFVARRRVAEGTWLGLYPKDYNPKARQASRTPAFSTDWDNIALTTNLGGTTGWTGATGSTARNIEIYDAGGGDRKARASSNTGTNNRVWRTPATERANAYVSATYDVIQQATGKYCGVIWHPDADSTSGRGVFGAVGWNGSAYRFYQGHAGGGTSGSIVLDDANGVPCSQTGPWIVEAYGVEDAGVVFYVNGVRVGHRVDVCELGNAGIVMWAAASSSCIQFEHGTYALSA